MSSLDLYVDFKSPASYLCLKPTLQLASELDVEIRWQPFVTSESRVPKQANSSEMGSQEDKGTTHRRVRAKARQDVHLHYAGVQGVQMCFPDEPGSTELSLLALSMLNHNEQPVQKFVELGFNAYWQQGQNLDEPGVVTALLMEAGYQITPQELHRESLQPLLNQDLQKAIELGVVDAPAYVVKDHLFIGREHLPWVRQLLADQR